jgi:hypothetical protein
MVPTVTPSIMKDRYRPDNPAACEANMLNVILPEYPPALSPEQVRVIREALPQVPDQQHELSGAMRMHEAVSRWWQGIGLALARGLEGSQARALLTMQISLCGADGIFLQVALDNAADARSAAEVDAARAALAEAREIEAKARAWLSFVGQPTTVPAQEQLARGMAAYERGETEALSSVMARLRARRSS